MQICESIRTIRSLPLYYYNLVLINLSFSPINGKTCYTYLCMRIVADPRGIITNRINTIIFARSIASLGKQHENGMKTDTQFIGTYR